MAKKASSIDPKIVKQLLIESSSTVSFLKNYFDLRVKVFGKPGYSVFSQRAGFSSRSHIRDILNGRVQITETSVMKIAKALGFKGEVAEFFYLKTQLEQLEHFTQSRQGLNQQLLLLKHKIECELDPLKADDHLYEIGTIGYWIMPCLSTRRGGSTLEEVERMCPLNPSKIKDGLKVLMETGFVIYNPETKKYLNHRQHIELKKMPKVTQPKDAINFWAILDSFTAMRIRFEKDFVKKPLPEPERPFVYRGLSSVPKSRYPEFKLALRSLLNEFVVNMDGPEEEDVLLEIVCGMAIVEKESDPNQGPL